MGECKVCAEKVIYNTRGMHDITGWAWANTHTEHRAVGTWRLSECDRDSRPQNMIQKVQTHAQLKNREFSKEVQHGLYDVLHACSTRCALQETCTTWCILHQDGMDRWSYFAIFMNYFWINIWCNHAQNKSCKWFTARRVVHTNRWQIFRPATPLGGARSHSPQ